MQEIDDNKKIKDPATNKNFVRGKEYINPLNGKKQIFEGHITTQIINQGKYKGFYFVYFVDKDRFNEIETRRKERYEKIKKNISNGKIKLFKSINPKTNKVYKQGDVKGKGDKLRYFFCYERWPKKIDPPFEGLFPQSEKWTTERTYIKKRLRRQLNTIKKRSLDSGIPFSIDFDYAMSIFPADNKCPILERQFNFGYDENNQNNLSPSLDKIIPKNGYVKNNVLWVSHLVNRIKSDATILELTKIGNFYKNLERKIENS